MDDLILTVRVRCTVPDPFAGLKGHDYIAARGLAPMVGPNASPLADNCACNACVQARLLPIVQAIVANWSKPEAAHEAAH